MSIEPTGGRVLLTCDTENVASAKIIEESGGGLRGQAVSKISGKLISRHWVEL
jgi:predicted acetyltransferase